MRFPGQSLGFSQSWFKEGVVTAQPLEYFMKANAGKNVNIYTLNLMDVQEGKLENYFQNKRTNGKITYNLIAGLGMDQCTSFASGAINSVQSDLSISGFSPWSAINNLDNNVNNLLIKRVDRGSIKEKYKYLKLDK